MRQQQELPPVPEMLASQLIESAKGSRRDAEAFAWAQVPAEPPDKPKSRLHGYWMGVIAALVDGTELPAVDDAKGRTTRAYRTRLGVA